MDDLSKAMAKLTTGVVFFLSLIATSLRLTLMLSVESNAEGLHDYFNTRTRRKGDRGRDACWSILNIQSRHGVAEIIDLVFMDAQRLEGGAEGFEIDIETWRD